MVFRGVSPTRGLAFVWLVLFSSARHCLAFRWVCVVFGGVFGRVLWWWFRAWALLFVTVVLYALVGC